MWRLKPADEDVTFTCVQMFVSGTLRNVLLLWSRRVAASQVPSRSFASPMSNTQSSDCGHERVEGSNTPEEESDSGPHTHTHQMWVHNNPQTCFRLKLQCLCLQTVSALQPLAASGAPLLLHSGRPVSGALRGALRHPSAHLGKMVAGCHTLSCLRCSFACRS